MRSSGPLTAERWDGADPAALMGLEQLDADLFTNRVSELLPQNHLFGGQVLAHALGAAGATVVDRGVHSVHGYYLRPGDASRRVLFRVERTRDGASFTTRRVVAEQNGAPIFHMECSFHVVERPGLQHQAAPPEAPRPEQLMTLAAFAAATGHPTAQLLADRLARVSGIELRLVDPEALIEARTEPRRRFWVRMPSAAGVADPAVHRQLLAYLSDFWFASGSLTPHHAKMPGAYPTMASLDHAIWFHRPGRVDDWLLYDIDSPSLLNATGLVRGLLYDRAGNLLASTAQEALVRMPRPAVT